MINLTYDFVTKDLLAGAILRNDFQGFKEDYCVLHALIINYAPKTFIEIGTSNGLGTNVICNAMQGRKVYSLDVPPGTDPKIIYPGEYPEDTHPDKAGKDCHFEYEQLFGDSRTYDYSRKYPLDGWFIDGKHNYEFCKLDSLNAMHACPKLVVWHDRQIEGVSKAVREIEKEFGRDVYQVDNTRIAFWLRGE